MVENDQNEIDIQARQIANSLTRGQRECVKLISDGWGKGVEAAYMRNFRELEKMNIVSIQKHGDGLFDNDLTTFGRKVAEQMQPERKN